ncbi:MAG: Protein-arginine-phosphatase [Dehalococcoidia bacterium]|nr:Protein-arginine-phosphatase [Bacillota bacterium]
MGNRKKILIVCGGNTCRSPMAKVILEQMLKSKGLEKLFKVDSAAYRGSDGTSAHPNARATIKELYGADLLADHIPKKLTDKMAEGAHLIIVMEEYMKSRLPAQKVVVLGVSDPFGPNIEKYRECVKRIQQRFAETWLHIVGSAAPPDKTEDERMILHSTPPSLSSSADWVYDEVLKIAKKVDFGRGKHAETVTRLLLNVYDDMVSIGLIVHSAEKRKLAKIIGVSHDIGVNSEKDSEQHNEAGVRMLKEQLWNEKLSPEQSSLLSTIIYAIFYHRDTIADGIVGPLADFPITDCRRTTELVALIRVVDGLDYGQVKGSPDKVEKLEVVRTSKGVEFRILPRAGKDVEGLIAKSYETPMGGCPPTNHENGCSCTAHRDLLSSDWVQRSFSFWRYSPEDETDNGSLYAPRIVAPVSGSTWNKL